MATVEQLVDPVVPVTTPQCEAIRVTRYYNDEPGRDMRCQWSSRYKVNGQFLCSKHAGPVALEILLNQTLNK